MSPDFSLTLITEGERQVKKSILTLLIALSTISFLHAQTEVTTKDGRKAILYEDGTWKYYIATPVVISSNGVILEYCVETPKVEVAQISYECADLISTKTDKMTGKTYTSNKEFLYISGKNRTGFRILCMKTTTYITIAIWDNEGVTSSYRSDDDDELEILFRDGSKLVLANDRQCYGVDFIIYFGNVFGKKKQLNELTTKEIETIRVWTSGGAVQKNFSNEQSKILMNTLKCLSQIKKDN